MPGLSNSDDGGLAARRPFSVARVGPEFFPVADEIRLGADHRVWIGLFTTADERLWAADGSHVWGVERDALDVQSGVRYRLVPVGPVE